MNHADILDIAQDNDQNERDRALALIQAKVKPIPTSDICLHCGEPTTGARWCDADCRNDAEEPARVGW